MFASSRVLFWLLINEAHVLLENFKEYVMTVSARNLRGIAVDLGTESGVTDGG